MCAGMGSIRPSGSSTATEPSVADVQLRLDGASGWLSAAAITSATVANCDSAASVVIVGGSSLSSPRWARSSAAATGTHIATLDSLVTSCACCASGSAATKNRVS